MAAEDEARTGVMPTTAELVAVGAIISLALAIRLPFLCRGLGQDELYTVVHFVDVPSIWTTIATNDAFNNHLGYSVAAHVAEAVLGRSEWVFRLPALVFGLSGIAALWLMVRDLATSRVALVTALVLALSPPHVGWSTSARGYSGLILFTLLSSLFYLRLLRHARRSDALLFVATSVIGIYVHLYAAFTILIQVLLLIRLSGVGANKHRTLRVRLAAPRLLVVSYCTIAGAIFLCYLPVLREMGHDLLARGRGDFNPLFPSLVIEEWSGADRLPIVDLLLGLAIVGVLALARRRAGMTRYLVCLCLLPVCVMVLLRPADLYARFFAFALPFFLTFCVVGLATLWRARLVWQRSPIKHTPKLLAVLVGAIVVLDWRTTWSAYAPDEGYREASLEVRSGLDASTPVCAIGGARSVWEYYVGRPLLTPTSLEEFLALAGAHADTRCVYYRADWQSPDQTQIAEFLQTHGSATAIRDDIFVFMYRTALDSPGSSGKAVRR